MAPNVNDAGHPDAPEPNRYAVLQIDDAAIVIYDEANHRAWIQSNVAVGLNGMV